jgi:putative membrane protein
VSIIVYAVFTEALLLGSIELENLVLSSKRVPTFRRLASLAIISNAVWFVLALAGMSDFWVTHSEMKFVSLVFLGAFFAISFRALIMGSLFYDKSWKAIPLAVVQPLLLLFPTVFTPQLFTVKFFLSGVDPLASVVGGLITLLGIEIYMSMINRVSVANLKPFQLLQAFLSAWAAEDSTNLERFLDATSREGPVRSQILSLNPPSQRRALIIVPGVHPGPFYPIGSSTLPSDIFARLSLPETIPMVVHSISDHDLNLPSKKQVERYVSSLHQETIIDAGNKMSEPAFKTMNKSTVIGLAFGLTLLIAITQAPFGGEDLPAGVQIAVESYASRAGFSSALIVDAHNSEGTKLNEKETHDAIAAAKQVIDILRSSPRFNFKVGVAHSSEMADSLQRDIGPAGIGLIFFSLENGLDFSLVIVDANNSVIGFREKVLKAFEDATSSRLLEICTSDTHITAAKTSDAKGYLALGDLTGVEKFTQILVSLQRKAKERAKDSTFSSSAVTSNVKTIGSDILSGFSGLLDTASTVAKNGARVLGIIALVIAAIVALI